MFHQLMIISCLSMASCMIPGSSDDNSSPGQLPSDVQMGDLKLTMRQHFAIKNKLSVSSSNNMAYAGAGAAVKKWKNGIVPYVINCALKNMPDALKSIKDAMAEWESKTCIRFVPHDGHEDYLTFFRDTHCWCNVGNIGKTMLSVGHGCEYRHVMVHEIGHAIGFWHEQNRPDRDTYVEVLWNNIEPWVKDAFDIVKDVDSLGVKYDYESIMHYPWSAFSSNGKDTMKPRQRTKAVPYEYLSKLDIEQVSRMYKCPSTRGRRDIDDEMEVDNEIESRQRRSTGCSDISNRCPSLAKSGYCYHDDWTRKNCRASCKFCTSTTPSTSGGCVDLSNRCTNLAKLGRCSTDAWMKTNCKAKCNFCSGAKTTSAPSKDCRDADSSCVSWKNAGYCGMHSVDKLCKKSCDPSCAVATVNPRTSKPIVTKSPPIFTRKPTVTGGACKDSKQSCPRLASQCTSDSVRDACRLTCGVCEIPKPCKDVQPTSLCQSWKDQCSSHSGIRRDCAVTCKVCPDDIKNYVKTGTDFGKGLLCTDKDNRCPVWAKQGDCNDEDSYATRHCLKSCRNPHCDMTPPVPSGSCSRPLGLSMASPNPLPDSAFSSPSHLAPGNWRASADNARLFAADDRVNKRIGAWCAADRNATYVQVDVGRRKRISSIATQGRDKYFERVSKFKVAFSDFNGNFKFVQKNNKDMVFDGNCDHFTPVLNKFPSQIMARYIRVYPVESNFPCLRMELYGC